MFCFSCDLAKGEILLKNNYSIKNENTGIIVFIFELKRRFVMIVVVDFTIL